MYAVVVNVTIQDREGAVANLRDDVVPRASSAPGFVSGTWFNLEDDKGGSVIVYETEEAATAVAALVHPPPDGAISVDSVTVREVVAHV